MSVERGLIGKLPVHDRPDRFYGGGQPLEVEQDLGRQRSCHADLISGRGHKPPCGSEIGGLHFLRLTSSSAVVEKINIGAVVDRIDVNSAARRIDIDSLGADRPGDDHRRRIGRAGHRGHRCGGIYLLGLAGASFAATIITGHNVTWHKNSPVAIAVFVAWAFAYFAYSWSADGRTPGMALLGLRVLRSSGARLSGWRAIARTLAFPLSFLVLGLGFALILVQRDRRALHDLIADTVVVYAWDARAARLRFLARR